jgi:phenylacetate-CoA ligase
MTVLGTIAGMGYLSKLRHTMSLKKPAGDGFSEALETFNLAAKTVPAYRDFLEKNNIQPKSVSRVQDFNKLPIVTKENYLRQYPLRDLLLSGGTEDARIISLSSGSSGKPFYWPRGNKSVAESVQIIDELFADAFRTREKETLCVMAFAMGTWIAGTYMLSAVNELANKGHKIVSVTPGINKVEIIQILKNIGDQFEQTIVMGYPPFIKDVVDAGANESLDFEKLNLRFVFAGENISENWREYVAKRVKAKDINSFSLSIFGTADAGIMGIESPFTVYLRRLLDQSEELAKRFFSRQDILPTLVQYEPSIRYVEEVDHHLVFTVNNSLPLVRYDILDEGEVISIQELEQKLRELDISIPKEYERFCGLPLIALYGRPDVAAMFYGLNIYPENIKYGLEAGTLQNYITGKFVLKTEVSERSLEQSLHLYIELKENVLPEDGIKEVILSSVVNSLDGNNSEYHKLHQELKRKAEPHIHLVEFDAPEFRVGIKHRWVAKS